MNTLSMFGANLPDELRSLCDAMLQPVSFSLQTVRGAPVVYVNQPFEYMTGASASDVLGRNYSFLDGPLTDIYTMQELKIALSQHHSKAGCLLSYRSDGSMFKHLIAFRPLNFGQGEILTMACHAAFNSSHAKEVDGLDTESLDRAWRNIRQYNGVCEDRLTEHDAYRLKAISMRFEAVFARVQNALIKRMLADQSLFGRNPVMCELASTYHATETPSNQEIRRHCHPFDLGPLTKRTGA